MNIDSHWVNTPPQLPSSRPRLPRLIALAVVLTTAFAGGIVGGIVGSSTGENTSNNAPLITAAPLKSGQGGNSNVARAASVIAPSVVTIASESEDGMSSGTGIIITSDGEILTNSHVIDGADTVRVRLSGATDAIVADVLATDPSNDVGLIKLRNTTGLTAATFADADSIAIGDQVVAVGYALALDGGPSVTSGIISALNRALQLDEDTFLNRLIQTDAAISSGNSGGPLINMNGQVVGINTAVASSGSNFSANNIGFAISIAEVQRVSRILKDSSNGVRRQQGYLGISLGTREDGGSGAIIGEITPDSPAERAGVKEGDIVLSVDGQPITGETSLVAIIRDFAPGERITITVERDGKKKDLVATLVARP